MALDHVVFVPSGDVEGPDLVGTDATVVSDTEITVTTPDATPDAGGKSVLNTGVVLFFQDPANPGNVNDDILSDPNTTSANAYLFGTPQIDSISPSVGSLFGGTTVTVTGSGFMNAALPLDTVGFDAGGDTGAIPAASFTVVSDTQITVTTPPVVDEANGAVEPHDPLQALPLKTTQR